MATIPMNTYGNLCGSNPNWSNCRNGNSETLSEIFSFGENFSSYWPFSLQYGYFCNLPQFGYGNYIAV